MKMLLVLLLSGQLALLLPGLVLALVLVGLVPALVLVGLLLVGLEFMPLQVCDCGRL
jgi:hypothetical protein